MKNSIKSLKRLWTYIRPYQLMFWFSVFFTVSFVALNAVLPYVTGLPTTEILKNVTNKETINFNYILMTIFWMLVITVLYSLAQYFGQVLMTKVVQRAMKDLRTDIAEKINRLPVSYFDTHQQGEVLSRVTNDVDAVSNAMQQSFMAVITAFLGITMAGTMMFVLNVQMALIAILMIPASILLSRYIVSKSQKYFQEQQNALGDLNGYVTEHMTGFNVLKLYGREEQSLDGFKEVSHRLSHFGFKSAFISGLMMPLVQFTAYIAYIVVAVLGSFFIIAGSLTVGNLQAFIQYIWQVNQPMGQVTQLAAVLQSASASTTRIFEILDEEEELVNDQDTPVPATVEGHVKFEHVAFSYDERKPLIKDLSFEVKPGQTVAIVGPTGAGKTTLINLLMRFYDVDSGAIKIDGIDMKRMNRSEVRSLFGMVLQDAWLYHDTIGENIRFGKLDATDYEVVDAAKTANVHHFIRTMPNGYEMAIDEEAGNVSLGQKQLLTIARAVISNPKILILDEATSSVDTRLEALIQKAMARVMEGRTSFVIAHRLSTIRDADLILVMNQGEIIEQGTHDELLATGGFYEQLYNSQFDEEGDYEEVLS
ncbi:ABC transporter ATP-binding protein [Vagococcus salmoninarum]|uniref:ABC transporter ATP-binding protein n=1 Tax=Vagococcus salmoninarum TaxID=2739 RepID=UPI00187E1A10|nr:ABC transporter ATP-binding protein [Vagococcus salmoninarum]MBE9390076.1 ABC transporter ATP-binding protein [Vagococcus salmoninarum]